MTALEGVPRRVDLADVRPGDRVRVTRVGRDWTEVVTATVESVAPSGDGWCAVLADYKTIYSTYPDTTIELLHRPRRLPVVGEPVTDDMDVPRNTRAERTDEYGDTWIAVMHGDAHWHITGNYSARGFTKLPDGYRVAFVPEPTT